MTPRHPRGEGLYVRSSTDDGIVVSFEVATWPDGPFVPLTDTEAENILRGTGTRFDLVTVPPRGLPPYTPTDPAPARVGGREA